MPKTSDRDVRVGWGVMLGLSLGWSAVVSAEDAAPPSASPPATQAPAPQTIDPEAAATFIKAARYGQSDVVKSYLDKHFPVTVTDYLGDTALNTAAGGGHADIVQMLLAAGAQVNVLNNEQRSALMAASMRGDEQVVKLLLDAKADVNAKDKQGETALFDAVRYAHLGVVKLLLDAGADPNISNQRPPKAPDSGYTPLMYAAKRGLVPDVIPVTDWLAITKALLDKGANPDTRSTMGATALNVAQDYGNQDIAALLLKGGAKQVLTYKGLDLNDALILAATHGDANQVVEALKAGADPQAVSRTGVTPLLAAAFGGSVEAVRVVVEHGADVNHVATGYRAWTWTAEHISSTEQPIAKTASLGYTALILAAQKGFADIVAYLLDHGADPKLADLEGDTPLYVASEQGHAKIVAMLLDKGVDPDEGQKVAPPWTAGAVIGIKAQVRNSPLSLAAQGGHTDTVKVLLEKGANPDVRGFAGKTALFWAVERGYLDVVNLLLEHNADPNIRNTAGQTPLMEAAKDGSTDLVRALVSHQADINAREGDDGLPGTLDVSAGTGMTPLIFAVVGGHFAVANILLQAGADVSMRNRAGQNALDVAIKGGNTDMINLLRGATVSAGR
jgi:ankyrin repeat protein